MPQGALRRATLWHRLHRTSQVQPEEVLASLSLSLCSLLCFLLSAPPPPTVFLFLLPVCFASCVHLSWLYRIRPSVGHDPFKKLAHKYIQNNFADLCFTPNQLRWKPFPLPAEGAFTRCQACGSSVGPSHELLVVGSSWVGILNCTDEKVDFVMGLRTIAGAGHPSTKAGMGIYVYAANADMIDTAFYTSDGDFLIGAPLPHHHRFQFRYFFHHVGG